MSTIAEVLASQQQSYVGTYTAGNFDSMKEDIARWAEKNPDSPFADICLASTVGIECDCSGCDCGMECKPECATNS